jgi:predicted  nucleic acid-binding Zn-ribbon protein
MSDILQEKESSDLSLHVSLCAERYKALDSRLTNLEEKVNEIAEEILEGKKSLATTIITSAGAIVISVVGLLGTILVKF